VAGGAAPGLFFGLDSPVAQMPLAAAGAILLRAPLPAAALGTLVPNPITVGPIYRLACHTGATFFAPAGTDHDLSNIAAAGGVGTSGSPPHWLVHVVNVGEPLTLRACAVCRRRVSAGHFATRQAALRSGDTTMRIPGVMQDLLHDSEVTPDAARRGASTRPRFP